MRVFVSIGSNIGREGNIRGAIRGLRACYGPLTLSKVYESETVGFSGEPFFNLVAAFETGDPPETVRRRLREIESAHGRTRGLSRFSPRSLDLDLLLYGEMIKHEAEINVPRSEIVEYAFVLRPLAEIAPDMHHPESDKTYEQLWREFGDRSQALHPVKIDLD